MDTTQTRTGTCKHNGPVKITVSQKEMDLGESSVQLIKTTKYVCSNPGCNRRIQYKLCDDFIEC